jgi:hypothetical protein
LWYLSAFSVVFILLSTVDFARASAPALAKSTVDSKINTTEKADKYHKQNGPEGP